MHFVISPIQDAVANLNLTETSLPFHFGLTLGIETMAGKQHVANGVAPLKEIVGEAAQVHGASRRTVNQQNRCLGFLTNALLGAHGRSDVATHLELFFSDLQFLHLAGVTIARAMNATPPGMPNAMAIIGTSIVRSIPSSSWKPVHGLRNIVQSHLQ